MLSVRAKAVVSASLMIQALTQNTRFAVAGKNLVSFQPPGQGSFWTELPHVTGDPHCLFPSHTLKNQLFVAGQNCLGKIFWCIPQCGKTA